MYTQTAASYLPDSQVITLKSEFDAFADPVNPRGLQGPEEIGFFFHEWIHYLHNVSTVQGLSAYANLVHLWSTFRSTIGHDGLSAGSAVLSEELALNVRQKTLFMSAARQRRQNRIPPKSQLQQIEFVSVSKRTDPIESTPFEYSTIICQIAVPRRGEGGKDLCTIEVGTHEILESVAYMLEERLVLKLGSISKVPNIDPYLLVPGIASKVVPGISKDAVILCALASLQDSDPPGVLIDILNIVGSAMHRGEDPLQVLRKTQEKVLLGSQEWVEDTLKEVENAFPNDEPMARAVKSTTETIRQNFAYRRSSPFLELELIDIIATSPSELSVITKTFGICALVQERKGHPDDINRDLMYDFLLSSSHDDELSFGWRMMHAAFRFIGLHFTKDGALPTESLRQGSRIKCPFYTACSYNFRQERPNDCAMQPWLAGKTKADELCWYGRAVYAIAPRPTAQQVSMDIIC